MAARDALGRDAEWEFEIGEDKPSPTSAPAAATAPSSAGALGAPSPPKTTMRESAVNVGRRADISCLRLRLIRILPRLTARVPDPR